MPVSDLDARIAQMHAESQARLATMRQQSEQRRQEAEQRRSQTQAEQETQTALAPATSILGEAGGLYQNMIDALTGAYGTRASRGAQATRQASLLSGFTPLEASGQAENIYNEALRQYWQQIPQLRLNYMNMIVPLWMQLAQQQAGIPQTMAQTEAIRAGIPQTQAQTEAIRAGIPQTEAQTQQTQAQTQAIQAGIPGNWEQRAREEAARQAYYSALFPNIYGGGAGGGPTGVIGGTGSGTGGYGSPMGQVNLPSNLAGGSYLGPTSGPGVSGGGLQGSGIINPNQPSIFPGPNGGTIIVMGNQVQYIPPGGQVPGAQGTQPAAQQGRGTQPATASTVPPESTYQYAGLF